MELGEGLLRRMCCAIPLFLCLALLCMCLPPSAAGVDLQDQGAVCNAEGCYSVHYQRKSFRESWKSCRDKRGSLATVKRPEEAALIHELLSSGERRGPRVRIRLWIGLQRQPRQCSATKPLRGFTWITGDQDTQYTNWQREDLPNTCSAPRCVVMIHNTADKSGSYQNNFKWLDGSCQVAVDGFLCRHTYSGMCPALQSEGGGPAIYTTPFDLVSTQLTHIPFGSVATLPCPEGSKGDQSVLCMLREDGRVGWSKDAPLCSDTPKDWCDQDNGGCEHFCVNTDTHYYCECSEDFQLGDDGQSCQPVDPCHNADCEYMCEPTQGGFQCLCQDGYLLASDGHTCLDIDECLQKPCPQLCLNAPGTFECRCSEGYQATEDGQCEDIDECEEHSCEHACENLPGSYSCHCHDGYSPLDEDPSQCQDVDECLIPGVCEHICQNYMGGFECHCEEGYELEDDLYSCTPYTEEEKYTTTEMSSSPTSPSGFPHIPGFPWLTKFTDWMTDAPSLEWITTDLGWFTAAPQEGSATTHKFDWPVSVSSSSPTSDWMMDATTPNIPDDSVQIDNKGRSAVSTSPNASSYLPNPRSSEVVKLLPKEKGGMERPTPASPEDTLSSAAGSEQHPEGGKQRHDKSWLLVALLIPLCVFIVVMLALGIVYCTSCAVEPRNKSVTDCYHWTTTPKPSETNGAKSQV
ncbi:endosialin [Chanos chanos]|uniref:Endosialin n=1 Tax=Chanos chanos TaxID=29144 RepID=A0A6J2W0R5_CHACN|nr:endosialin [Chanos chanos]